MKKSITTSFRIFIVKFLALCTMIFCFTNQGSSQMHPCGTDLVRDGSAIPDNLREMIKTNREKTTVVMPVKFHIVQDDDGRGGILEHKIKEDFDFAKTYFEDHDIELKFCGKINRVFSSELYNLQRKDECIPEFINSFNTPNVINVYITNSVNVEEAEICGYSYFPWSDFQHIVIDKDCLFNGAVLAHEIGHYLGLLHTHETYFGEELVDGSNCEGAGDRFCDTPADPKLSYDLVNENCDYIETLRDVNDDLYKPDPSLIMSYSRFNCVNIFSDEQGAYMHEVIEFFYKNYACGYSDYAAETNIYPNPATDHVYIIAENRVEASLYNSNGQLVLEGNSKHCFNVSGLIAGTYFVVVKHVESGERETKKLVVY